MTSSIGELLVKKDLIDSEALTRAKDRAKAESISVLSAIVALSLITEDDLLELLSETYCAPVVELEEYAIDDQVMGLIPKDLAQKHGMLPLVKTSSSLTVAVCDPTNMAGLHDVKFLTGLDVNMVLTSEEQLKAHLEKHYDNAPTYDTILEGIEEEDLEVVEGEEEMDLYALEKATEDAPVVKLVNAILTDSIKRGASDIHVEPYEKIFRVRFRIDGVLYEMMKPPTKLRAAIISRIKIMANLDISERRLPQDGRIKLKMGQNREMDFRVSSLPTLFGEKVVLRLLDKSNLQLDMTKLGFYEDQLVHFKKAIFKPYGMVLVTGPTGSGKTTTLYSALAELNKISTNISTAEDPVEFNLMGINQAQMHDDIGFNFSAALRSFLRQDPDIIMVGEIRDYETAEIAIKASLTGHLVLSTLHTNDAPSTINRLLNMGVEPFLVASSVNLVLAQRLARRVCSTCAEDIHDPDVDMLVGLGIDKKEIDNLNLKEGRGCERCSGTGYSGRVALYEALPNSEAIRDCILGGASASEIKQIAIEEGMKSLRASGLQRLREGVTTVEEVLRVTAED